VSLSYLEAVVVGAFIKAIVTATVREGAAVTAIH